MEEERDKPSRRTDDGTAKKEKKGGITCEPRARRPEGYFSPFFVCLFFCFLFWGSKCLDLICFCRSQPGLRGGTHKHTHTHTHSGLSPVPDGTCARRWVRAQVCAVVCVFVSVCTCLLFWVKFGVFPAEFCAARDTLFVTCACAGAHDALVLFVMTLERFF